MGCECNSNYCHKCRGMIWSLLGVLLLLNAFVWPKWNGVDGWFGFIGLLLMLVGVWKAYVHGCSCSKEGSGCCKAEVKQEPVIHHEIHHEAPVVEAPVVHKAPKKRKR